MNQPRPVAATTFGILNIGFAVWGLGGVFFSTIARTMIHQKNPLADSLTNNPDYQTFLTVSSTLEVITASVLLAAGIGLLMLKNWARFTSIGYGIYKIIYSCIIPFFVYRIVMVPMITKFAQTAKGIPPNFIETFALIATIFGAIISLIYPVLLIIFMTRPKMIAAFQPPPQENPSLM